MIIRSKAPLRLGFAGGGSDLPSFSKRFGGAVFNATINQYSHCTIFETNNRLITFHATDLDISEQFKVDSDFSIHGELSLHRAVYKRFLKDFGIRPQSFYLASYSDVPPGSGLGSSSTMVVAIIQVFLEWLGISLSKSEIAKLAYEIERVDLSLTGGKQDQYAAAFGGINFMEFNKDDTVKVTPISIESNILDEISEHIVLYYSGISRSAAEISDFIIQEQTSNIKNKSNKSLKAMKATKEISHKMKDAFIAGNIEHISNLLNESWEHKKQTADKVSNQALEHLFNLALKNNAKACKLSGAGGGGFSIFIVDPISRNSFIRFIKNYADGFILTCEFTNEGCKSWRI